VDNKQYDRDVFIELMKTLQHGGPLSSAQAANVADEVEKYLRG
jgi:hypothetical protein